MVDDDDYSFDDDFESPHVDTFDAPNSIEPKRIIIQKVGQHLHGKNPAFQEDSTHCSVKFEALVKSNDHFSTSRYVPVRSNELKSKISSTNIESDPIVPQQSVNPPTTITPKTKTFEESKPNKVPRYSKRRINELAKPRAHHVNGKNAASNTTTRKCDTFSKDHTKKIRTRRPDNANEYVEKRVEFLGRMETMEKRRREKLKRAAAEALYQAQVDKKRCPNCGTQQSFDEVMDGRNECQNDRCKKYAYQYPAYFVLSNFEKRIQRSSNRRAEVLGKIEEERRISCSQTHEKSRLQQHLLNKISNGGNDFITRMKKDVEKRKDKIDRLEEISLEIQSKVCTFKPKLNIKEHLIQNRKGGVSELAAPIRRNEALVKTRTNNAKSKKKKRRRKPLESPWHQSNRSKKQST
eukprot:CAMPEP_0171376794 /NCGR_PEP_ID=MMETSP0879-20121228/19485_1 /TAXON_ID=67004 /ORGANISM="Thalassiosira weissflogii, Strain CCMP1336" /LENGTH=406 /DNA_ID=CAMNT_0011886739 /DNA_START=63 /DNA_END=1279 /DNA_ORIENTATION=-